MSRGLGVGHSNLLAVLAYILAVPGKHMGECDNTAYLQTDRLDEVQDALVSLCAIEGYVPAQPRVSPDDAYRMQYQPAEDNDTWAIAILPGIDRWCVVKTAPLDLLIQTARGRSRPRLAYLSFLLQCNAFQFSVGEQTSLLLECDPNTAHVTGFRFDDEDFYEHLINPGRTDGISGSGSYNPFLGERAPDRHPPFFELLTELEPISGPRTADSYITAQEIGEALTGQRIDSYWGNQIQVEFLLRNSELPHSEARVVYLQRHGGG